MKQILREMAVALLIGAITGLAGYGIHMNGKFHPKNFTILILCLILGQILAKR